MQVRMSKPKERLERQWRGVPVATIIWWAALILCMSCLLGLNTLLDP